MNKFVIEHVLGVVACIHIYIYRELFYVLGVFNSHEKLYGRVYWNPKQDLESAFRLQLDKVFVCTGRDGYIPTYDPTGTVYNEEPQYGCLEPSGKLQHRFLVLVSTVRRKLHT